MKKASVTRTLGKLHFEDLDHNRFEYLCLNIVYRLNRWKEINHPGVKGNDKGIDISAIQELDNGAEKLWSIQCKRYKNFAKAEVKKVIDTIITKNKIVPNVLLLVISCHLSKLTTDYFKKYSLSKGVKLPLIWTASIIEAKLYSEHHDLLFAYFGISLTRMKREKVASIRRNIQLKKRMRNDFFASPEQINQVKLRNNPNEKFKYDMILIRSIDDTSYPNNDDIFATKISPWFKIPLYDFYHNGIEVLLNRHIWNTAIVDANGKWKIIDKNKKIDKKKFKKIELAAVGRIPFDNIIDYDLEPDGINNEPHIYCDFKNNGEPYEEIIYVINNDGTDDNMMKSYPMDNANRIE